MAAAAAAGADVAQLHYFSGRGRAEQSRWMLAATQTPFVNVPLASAADFRRLNDDGLLLFGQVPLLRTADGVNVVQSQAIIRYLAHKHSLMGDSARERVLADQAAEGASDFRAGLLSYPFSRNRRVRMAGVGLPCGNSTAGSRFARLTCACSCGRQQCAGCVRKYAPIFESLLQDADFVAGGTALTYADVLLAGGWHTHACAGTRGRTSSLMTPAHTRAQRGRGGDGLHGAVRRLLRGRGRLLSAPWSARRARLRAAGCAPTAAADYACYTALPVAHARVCCGCAAPPPRCACSHFQRRKTRISPPSSLRCICLAGVAAYLASPQRFPFPDGAVADAYVKNVGDVLN
jgi:glutathione S-transferase